MTNKDRADSILINMSKAELVDLTCKYHPHASLPLLRGYTKRDLRALVVRAIPAEVLIQKEEDKRKQEKHPKNLYSVNTEVYYTGDMANHSGRGFVQNFRENSMGRSMDIVIKGEWDAFTEAYTEDRKFNGLTMAHFAPGPGRRFWTLEDWRADRKAKIEQQQEQLDSWSYLQGR